MEVHKRAVFAVVIFVITLILCLQGAESRPRRHASSRRYDYDTRVEVTDSQINQYFDYDYANMEQGLRSKRWAFPSDVQDIPCPQGTRRHGNGISCVPENKDYEPDY